MIVQLAVAATLVLPVHDWYPKSCCSDKDCHPVPCAELEHRPDGSVKWRGFEFNKHTVLPSKDIECHVCVSDTTIFGKQHFTPRCAFTYEGT